MTTSHRRTTRATLASGLAAGLALTAVLGAGAATATPPDKGDRPSYPERVELPDGFQPEGITIGKRATAYFGSRLDGDLYSIDLRTGEGEVVSQGPGTPSVGLKVDKRERLFVSGGTAGDARVVDARSGTVLASYQLAEGTAFINDVVLTRDTAWFTDSENAQLFALPLGKKGRLPAPEDVVTIPLGGEWVQNDGLNANGITETPDGRALLVVNSSTGELFRVDRRSGRATEVDLGGTLLTNGDGLLLQGRTLYAVQNRLNKIAVIELDKAGTSGTKIREITSPDFDVPTTVAKLGKRLYLPNARFTTPPTPTTDYWVTQVSAR